MKANELMIGDWVECVDSTHKKKVYAQIDAIEECQTCILVKLDNCNWFLDISFIKPIPLTPEILEKNGFERTWRDVFAYDNEDIGLIITFHLKETNYTNGAYDYIDIERGCMTITEMPIEFVHQLQQALRLCGIDKTIEL